MEAATVQEASVITPTVMLVAGMVFNGIGLLIVFGMLFTLSHRQGTMNEALVEFEADARADNRILAEVLRCYFFQGSRPRESELAAIGLRREQDDA